MIIASLIFAAVTIVQPARFVIPTAGGGGGTPIAFRTNSFHTITAVNNTVTEPTGAASGDIFVALAMCDTASTSLGAPAGWTTIYSGSGAANFKYNLSWIRRGGSAPSLVWTTASSVYSEVQILAYHDGVAAGTPYEASVDGGNSSGLNPDCPSITTINANAIVIAIAINWSGSNVGGWALSGYVVRSNNANGNDTVMADKSVVSPGAENPPAFTNGGGPSAQQWQAAIALQD